MMNLTTQQQQQQQSVVTAHMAHMCYTQIAWLRQPIDKIRQLVSVLKSRLECFRAYRDYNFLMR